MKNFLFINKKGFSVAEAMITLLIVSLALAAAAPLFTKRNVSSQNVEISIPSGMVAFFDLDVCPSGWSKLDSKYDGAFIRNTGGAASTRGERQASAVPNLKGYMGMHGETTLDGSLFSWLTPGAWSKIKGADGTEYRSAVFNANNYSSVYQDGVTEVRPDNVALLGCRKN